MSGPIEITDAERLAAVRAIQQLASYRRGDTRRPHTWERVVDTAVAAINEARQP